MKNNAHAVLDLVENELSVLPVGVSLPEESQQNSKDLVLGFLGLGTGAVAPFNQVFKQGCYVTPSDIEAGTSLDALVVWGGEDISPSIYGQRVSDYTDADAELSKRDRIEVTAVQACISRGIPVIGVCRGAQLLCAIAGGTLIQHVNGHAGTPHSITTKSGETVVSSSVHHQMMFPFNVDHELIAWASPKRAKQYINGDNEQIEEMEEHEEPEIVWFPKVKGLAIQGHPEFHGNPEKDPFVQLCMKLTRQYIIGEVV